VAEAAEKAARKLRGEETEDRAMEAEKPGEYQTRASKSK
jgi:hypothetical protein